MGTAGPPKHGSEVRVPSGVDTTIPPLEPVDAAAHAGTARADAIVVAAWIDHHEEIYAFLVRATRDPAAAEDLLSEAFLRLTHEARADRAPDNVRAWLYRVAANLAASRGRHLASAVRWFNATAARLARTDPDDPPETRLLVAESQARLLGAMSELGSDARAALLLSAEGFTGAEIADAIGRSEAATRTLMSRARVQVRGRLGRAEAWS